ncbi:hypothetical protein [Candidatus Uabimicrobium amorphum]|uniref:Uncharacterized protein n=1 Tax=Uabimicrobium amorphum TaxID=2596890 RepID=A0A5S9F3F2_UABAM|nr:hypothetical protein [Candidatus Uabimicrobium amorphum]BBM84428.1 hypothetical protein UABAM_02788 [Candidatus Uabimicrobium amorphum]
MSESKLEKIDKIYRDLREVFIENEGVKIFTEAKDVVKPLLYDLAKITFYASIVENKEDEQALAAIAKLYKESLKDVQLAVADEAKNYALERLEKFIRDMALNVGLKILLP